MDVGEPSLMMISACFLPVVGHVVTMSTSQSNFHPMIRSYMHAIILATKLYSVRAA